MVAPFNIQAEHSRCADLTARDLSWLRDRAVPHGALLKSGLGQWSMLTRDHVVFFGERFEFSRHIHDGESVGAFAWPAHDEFGDITDLIAWRPPATVGTWLGRIGMAGEEMVSAARFGEPLHVHADVLSWFRAGREGVVVVDPVRVAPLLRRAGRLAVATMAERRRLEVLLTVKAPKIEVVSGQVAQKLPATVREMEPAF